MQIVVNDTNIFFDLITAEMVEIFFRLPFEVHTTDFVINEIEEEEQKIIIAEIIARGELIVVTSEPTDLEIVYEKMNQNHQLSIEDCSVWHYSEVNDFILLTGDGALRKAALKAGVDVKGLLFVFDELVERGLLLPQLASEKLRILLNAGTRLPQKECDDRIKMWLNG